MENLHLENDHKSYFFTGINLIMQNRDICIFN